MSQLEQRRLFQESEAVRAALETVNEKLLERDRSKDEFLAMLSHELRNPLSPIVMTLDFLKRKELEDGDIRRGLDLIGRQAQHLVRLVDDLLDASRIATGKISLQRTLVSARQVIHRSVEMAQPALDHKKHTFTVELPEQEVELLADEVHICQPFSNLLNNAVRYTPEGGAVCLQAQLVEEGTLQVSVSDNGEGISEKYLDRIFESFVQVPKSGKTGGLGIGLHLCKHIVHMHQGTLRASSAGPGQGSTFTVTLPIHTDESSLALL